MFRAAVFKVFNGIRLQQLVHHTTFRDIQFKKAAFIQPLLPDQLVILNGKAVNGMILTEWALIDPAIGKDKIVFRNLTGT